MRVDGAVVLPVPREPAGEGAKVQLALGRHVPGFDEGAQGKERRLLVVALVAEGKVHLACPLRQVLGAGDVGDVAAGLLELLQRQRRLAAAGAADQHQRRGLLEHRLLHIVEGQRLVEQVDAPAAADAGSAA